MKWENSGCPLRLYPRHVADCQGYAAHVFSQYLLPRFEGSRANSSRRWVFGRTADARLVRGSERHGPKMRMMARMAVVVVGSRLISYQNLYHELVEERTSCAAPSGCSVALALDCASWIWAFSRSISAVETEHNNQRPVPDPLAYALYSISPRHLIVRVGQVGEQENRRISWLRIVSAGWWRDARTSPGYFFVFLTHLQSRASFQCLQA